MKATGYGVPNGRSRKLAYAWASLRNLQHSFQQYNLSKPNCREISSSIDRVEVMNGRPVRRSVAVLPIAHGCGWKQRTGGCFNCGMAAGYAVTLPSVLFVEGIIHRLGEWAVSSEPPPEWLCVYNEGSFLNPCELPVEAQRSILESISASGHIKRVTVESRPEFVTEEVLDWLENLASVYGMEIEIGMGIEIRNDFVRKMAVNKGFSWASFAEKVTAIARRPSLRSLSYVLIKPLFLTESEAIKEGIRTVEDCFRIGVNAVSLETMSIQGWTLVEYLWLLGLYELPSLWSVLEIGGVTSGLGDVRIGGEPETYYPHSLVASFGCAKCSEIIWRRIRLYNRTHDARYVVGNYCECQEEWQGRLQQEDGDGELESTLTERIIKVAASPLSLQDYLRRKIIEGGKCHGYLS